MRLPAQNTHLARLFCARGENRTHMTLRSANFKSAAATNYATRAGVSQIKIQKAKVKVKSQNLCLIFEF